MDFQLIDNCPVPKQLADEIMQIKKLSGAHLNSCDRSSDAEPMLAKCGKMSQRELYDGFCQHKPGFNPANPPGYSTHERRNDGIAYPVPRGAQLEWWQVGMDWDNPPAVIKAAAKLGWIVTTTYPNAAREVQHLNFRKEPESEIPWVHPGDTGDEVRKMTRILKTVRSPIDHKPYLPEAFPHYGPKVVAAVKKFQKEHHQRVDGKMGPQTATQLAVALRRHQQDPAHA
jgi:putative peptidoglycan binding protein